MTLSVADRKRLRDGAGGECSFFECRARDHLVEAHIIADRPGGPRGDASCSKAELDAYDNRLILCPTHHSKVDADPSTWTVGVLRAMKKEHERDIAARSPASLSDEELWLEPGAPTFTVSPGVHKPTAETCQLLMTFGQTSGDEVTPIVEWSGANVEPVQPRMMPENQRPGARFRRYQLKPALARPSSPTDEVTFDIRFRWRGATRQYRWSWPLYVREQKGIWGMKNTAENVNEPKDRTTLGSTSRG